MSFSIVNYMSYAVIIMLSSYSNVKNVRLLIVD